jgi:creatinine amidohydrolase/Fe(II)-dependent formamide hydrolase-like protein
MGTVWLSKETMKNVLLDICQSLKPYAKTIVLTSFHGGNLKLLDLFVTEYANTFGDVRIVHLPMGSDETEEKMCQIIGGETDAHAGNVEISMMLAHNDTLAEIPHSDYPKHVIEKPFSTNHIKDFSKDGIADNHPKWVVSKKNGQEMIKWMVEDFKNELRKIF